MKIGKLSLEKEFGAWWVLKIGGLEVSKSFLTFTAENKDWRLELFFSNRLIWDYYDKSAGLYRGDYYLEGSLEGSLLKRVRAAIKIIAAFIFKGEMVEPEEL